MEIHSLEIDIDVGVLKINGRDYKEKPIVVTLPGPEGWPLVRLFNAEKATGIPGACDELTVSYVEKVEVKEMSEEQKRLEKALLDFIERVSSNAASEKEVEIIPEAALALIELWKITRSF
ncbi:hypothetical protein [Lacrimispora indolis]|uniref:hypothetical protein n=1 Tax=Lacrimispora indolis TaxID=69825 RepID=UPI00045E660D|nr:hypothetical protein [Lacrimispora indolis]